MDVSSIFITNTASTPFRQKAALVRNSFLMAVKASGNALADCVARLVAMLIRRKKHATQVLPGLQVILCCANSDNTNHYIACLRGNSELVEWVVELLGLDVLGLVVLG